MKKMLFVAALVCGMVALGMSPAVSQTVGKKTVEQFSQMADMCTGVNPPAFTACSAQLQKYGFVYNPAGVIDMFTMKMHPFFRAEGEDTVGCMLAVYDDKVLSMSGIFSSIDAGRAFGLVAKASDLQARRAAAMGCTKYVGSVKGKVKKVSSNRDDIMAALEGVDAEMVSMVFEQWKSADGKKVVTCIYENKRYGKKKPRDKDRVELTLGMSNTPERQ